MTKTVNFAHSKNIKLHCLGLATVCLAKILVQKTSLPHTKLVHIAQFLQAVKLVLYKAGTMYFMLKNIALNKN